MFSNQRRNQVKKSSKKGKTSIRSVAEIAHEKAQTARRRQLEKIDADGPIPLTASNFFIASNKDYYNIPKDHVVSLSATPVEFLGPNDVAAGLGFIEKRKIAYLNAGKPTNDNQDAGKGFHYDYKLQTGDAGKKSYEEVSHDLPLTQMQTHKAHPPL